MCIRDSQSIYRFRGSKPEIMLGFEKDYPDAKRILLDTNYRCGRYIAVSYTHLALVPDEHMYELMKAQAFIITAYCFR